MVANEVKRGRGRPKEDLYVKYIAGKEEAISTACENGADTKGLAKLLQCSPRTIQTIRREYPRFKEIIERANEVADEEIESALFRRAKGYEAEETITEVKVSPDGSANTTYVKKVKKHVPPDTTAAIFWLKNRCRARWSDRQDVTLDAQRSIAINIIKDNGDGRET